MAFAMMNVLPPLNRPISAIRETPSRRTRPNRKAPSSKRSDATPWISWLLVTRNARSSNPSTRCGQHGHARGNARRVTSGRLAACRRCLPTVVRDPRAIETLDRLSHPRERSRAHGARSPLRGPSRHRACVPQARDNRAEPRDAIAGQERLERYGPGGDSSPGPRADGATRRVALRHHDAVAERVVEGVRATSAPPRRTTTRVVDDARGHDQDRHARCACAERPVDVLGVGEQRLVEPSDALRRGARDEHCAATGAISRIRR